MGSLRNPSGRELPLAARVLIGRSPSCTLMVDAAHASSEHAVLSWTGDGWELRDLGSKNGTFVDGRRLEAGATLSVRGGERIGFGASSAEESYELADPSAPGLVAQSLEDGALLGGEELLALPSDEHPSVTIYRDPTGAWVAEGEDGELVELVNLGVVIADRRAFRVHLPAIAEGTPMVDPRPSLESVSFRFAVSSNEERVEVTLIHRGRERPIEAREHGYVLLTLARLRQEDADRSPAERGWIDRKRLEKMLGIDSNSLNVLIHRARHQLVEAGIEGAQRVVEVRRGERRLGTDRFQIVAL